MLCYTVNRIRFYNGKDNNQENVEQTGEIKPREVDTSTWDTSKIDIYTDATTGEIVPVPKGYVVSGKDDEHTVNTGLVIYEGDEPVTNENAWDESLTRNQWVWVPVPDVTRIHYSDSFSGKKTGKSYEYTKDGRREYTKTTEPVVLEEYDNESCFSQYSMQGMTKQKLLEELQEEYYAMITSVERYGGYYMGRYETGDVSSKGTYKRPVVVRMKGDNNINYITWYSAYNRLKYLGANEGVKSNIIWGCLWDETLQWLVDSGNKTYEELYNSKDWGNHYESEFDYTMASGETSYKNTNRNTIVPTGSAETNKANNIYDLAGNMWEWTLEGNGLQYRRCRGGGYGNMASIQSVSYRYDFNPNYSQNNWGARAYFYIK